MRRNRTVEREKYIDVRITQLEEEREKCHSDYDKQWYQRVINELHWSRENIRSDCWIQEGQLRNG